jgi:hypothetical protein
MHTRYGWWCTTLNVVDVFAEGACPSPHLSQQRSGTITVASH